MYGGSGLSLLRFPEFFSEAEYFLAQKKLPLTQGHSTWSWLRLEAF